MTVDSIIYYAAVTLPSATQSNTVPQCSNIPIFYLLQTVVSSLSCWRLFLDIRLISRYRFLALFSLPHCRFLTCMLATASLLSGSPLSLLRQVGPSVCHRDVMTAVACHHDEPAARLCIQPSISCVSEQGSLHSAARANRLGKGCCGVLSCCSHTASGGWEISQFLVPVVVTTGVRAVVTSSGFRIHEFNLAKISCLGRRPRRACVRCAF